METLGLVFLLLAGCGVSFLYARGALRAWRRWRGVRLVTCPETARAAAVTVDAMHAATTAFFEHAPNIRLSGCSRWPARGDCDQPCVDDLARKGNAATVGAVMTRWYSGRRCAFCGRPIQHVTSHGHPPALIGQDGVTAEWSSLPPEHLPDVCETHRAACWGCHLAETFRRVHPELVVDRPAPPTKHVA